MKSRLKKLRHTSFSELRVRGSQALAAFAERRLWTQRTRLISDDAFLRILDVREFSGDGPRLALDWHSYLQSRKGPPFLPSFSEPERTLSELRLRWPKQGQHIVERADQIVDGYFDLLGFHHLSFGSPIDWHLEPIASKRAPLVHWSRLNYLDSSLFGDKKITWELNRHQYFATLGQAYWLTGDERYAKTFTAHIVSWIAQNPPKLGINWASSLEVAFRSISWLWALHFFRHAAELTAEVSLLIAKTLYLNALHLETYLSTYFSPNTHLTGEALGLFYLGVTLPEFKDSSRWRSTGLRILTEQLERHVQADGAYFEQSSYYHRYTTDFYLHLQILLNSNGQSGPPGLNEKLQLLLDHLMYITRPDGTTPFFGDDDGGRLVKLDTRAANDFRATLSTGAAVFKRADYKFVADGAAEETLWLLGPAGLAQLDRLVAVEPARQSVGFEKSGYYVMRDGWTAEANFLLFDCGHHGAANCGHAHADALGFDLAVNGRTLIVDPGTYTYTVSKEMRDWFRSSAAHNTLTIDGESSSTPAGPFSWETIANCERKRWMSRDRFDYIVASHDGYKWMADAPAHQRAILFLKKDYWILRDQIDMFGTHQVKTWFHFNPNVEPLRSQDRSLRVLGENGHSAVLQLAAFTEGGEWVRESGWVSHCYGVKEEAPVFTYSLEADGLCELITFLVPEVLGASSKPVVREVEALNGRAFEINNEGRHDVLLFRGSIGEPPVCRVETPRFVSNFDVAWVRFSSERARNPEELVLIGGHRVELDGRVLLESTKYIDYLVASKVGERFRVETNEGVLEISLPATDLENLFVDLTQDSAN
jgi:uncharacterized heparinase superfamily protein